jgi:hypothetical protein
MSRLIWPKTVAVVATVSAAFLLGANAPPQAAEHKAQMMGEMHQTPESKRLEAHVKTVKSKATKEGYACCIRPSCDWCAVHMGHCMCHHGVESCTGPCRECHGGWAAGRGVVDGKTKEDVRSQPVMKM